MDVVSITRPLFTLCLHRQTKYWTKGNFQSKIEPMTGLELRTIREARRCTREQFALELKGCTAQAIVKWERDERPIPAWVEEKLLRSVQVTLPLSELAQLLTAAVNEQRAFEDVLVEALRDWLATHATKPATTTPTPIYPTGTTSEARACVAESELPYGS
jgi:DNA-binding transcriptional regulator YiaG